MEEFLTLNNQRGIDPITNLLLKDRLERVRQIFRNIEDVAQEAFVRVWKNREKYRAQGKFSTFLYRITYNLALNRIRDEKRKPLPGMPKLDGIEIAQQDLCSDTPEEIASRGDWAGLIS